MNGDSRNGPPPHSDDDDEAGDDPNAEVESPNLKPSYVEELEARTKAAEQKMLEVNSRFEQLRQAVAKRN